MQLNSFSDYTLRILIYLAHTSDRLVTSREIANTYGLSFDHIAKAAQLLSRENYVKSLRGRGGGMRLAKHPSEISIGEIVRLTEAENGLVECMRPGPTNCLLAKVCGLAPLLSGAQEAFYQHLDAQSLADALPKKTDLQQTFKLVKS